MNITPSLTSWLAVDGARQTLSGIIGQGQSLSNGFTAQLFTEFDTLPAPGGLKLHDPNYIYNMKDPDNRNLELTPLTEKIRKAPGIGYPANVDGKTPHSSMAAQITELCKAHGKAPVITTHSVCGIGGAALGMIRKGGPQNAYAASMFEAKAITRLAREQGRDISFDVVLMTHGETDALLGNQEYDEHLTKFMYDYKQDLMEITGQKNEPIMILSQQSTNPMTRNTPPYVSQYQWRIQIDSKNSIICACPKYQFSYSDKLHLPAGGYDRLGEKYGQVYYQTLVENKPFIPLRPKKLTLRDPTTVLVEFDIPHPPLQWDDYLPWPHQSGEFSGWSAGRGFEARDSNGTIVGISSVSIEPDGESVAIKLTEATEHLPVTIAYAWWKDDEGFCGGMAGGRVGHLRDSDPIKGASREILRCHMVAGQRKMICCDPEKLLRGGLFRRRAVYDIIRAVDIPFSAVVVDLNTFNPEWAGLSVPWLSNTGEYDIEIWHNQYNYLVQFELVADGKQVRGIEREGDDWKRWGSC